MEKEMATHSSILAWRIPGTEEPGGLLSMGSHRVRTLKSLSLNCMLIPVVSRMMASKEVYILIPGACGSIILDGDGKLVCQLELRFLMS